MYDKQRMKTLCDGLFTLCDYVAFKLVSANYYLKYDTHYYSANYTYFDRLFSLQKSLIFGMKSLHHEQRSHSHYRFVLQMFRCKMSKQFCKWFCKMFDKPHKHCIFCKCYSVRFCFVILQITAFSTIPSLLLLCKINQRLHHKVNACFSSSRMICRLSFLLCPHACIRHSCKTKNRGIHMVSENTYSFRWY